MSVVREIARKVYEFIVDYNLLDKGDEVGLLLSLGKDSIALLEILNYLNEKFNLNLNITPIIVVFPKHKYSKINLDEVKKLLGNAHIIIPPYDDNILEGVEKPCTKCKLIRRTYILKALESLRIKKIATAHTLNDLYAYLIELLSLTNFHLDRLLDCERGVEVLTRYLPKLTFKEGYVVIRPLLKVTEDETRRMALQSKIPITLRCMYSRARPKRIISNILKLLEAKLDYDSLISFISKHIDLKEIELLAADIRVEEYIV